MEEDILIGAEEIENVSEEDMEKLERLVEEYQSVLQRHGEELDDILERINNSDVYKELGVQISVDKEYYYSVDERE